MECSKTIRASKMPIQGIRQPIASFIFVSLLLSLFFLSLQG